MSALVPARSPAPLYSCLSRRPRPVPESADFTAILSIFQQGERQTNNQLAALVRAYLQAVHEGQAPGAVNPWTVEPLPFRRGPSLQPTEVVISCRTRDLYGSDPLNNEELVNSCHELIDEFLWKQFQSVFDRQDTLHQVYSDRLTSISLRYPAVPTDNTISHARIYIHKFHIPDEWKNWENTFIRTKFYQGPLLAADRIADILMKYESFIRQIPVGFAESSRVNAGIAGLQAATAAAPRLQENFPVLRDLDRSSVKDLVNDSYPAVLRCLEDALQVLEELVIETKSCEPSAAKSCLAVHKLYKLKLATPKLTAVLAFLVDKKRQDAYIWGSVALTGALIIGGTIITVSLLPVAAPIVAGGALVAEAGTAAAVTTVTTATAVTAGSGTTGALAASVVGGGMWGVSLGGTLGAIFEVAQTKNMVVINEKINEGIQTILYYIALCHMKSSGIHNPREATDLNEIVEKLYGRRPPRSKQVYRAAFLHSYIRQLAIDFKKVTKTLQNVGFENLEPLDWEPQFNDISLVESPFAI